MVKFDWYCNCSSCNTIIPTSPIFAVTEIYQLHPISTNLCTFLYHMNLLLLLCWLGLQPMCYILFSVFHNKYALYILKSKSDVSIIVIRNTPFFCSEICTGFPNLQFNKILSMHLFKDIPSFYFSQTLWNLYKINSF